MVSLKDQLEEFRSYLRLRLTIAVWDSLLRRRKTTKTRRAILFRRDGSPPGSFLPKQRPSRGIGTELERFSRIYTKVSFW